MYTIDDLKDSFFVKSFFTSSTGNGFFIDHYEREGNSNYFWDHIHECSNSAKRIVEGLNDGSYEMVSDDEIKEKMKDDLIYIVRCHDLK